MKAISLGALVVLIAVTGCGRWRRERHCRQSMPSSTCCVAVGRPAPDFSGQDLDGAPFKLSDYRGKVVVLDFSGHW